MPPRSPPSCRRQRVRDRRHEPVLSDEVVMAGPLLETKLHVPAGRRSLVPRPRLSERLSRGTESALTLVSAPAGFGKTTLLTEWLSTVPAEGRSVAWLSVDQRDNDPALFWTYVATALQTAEPAVGAGALALLQSAQSSTEAVLSSLLNDLSGVADARPLLDLAFRGRERLTLGGYDTGLRHGVERPREGPHRLAAHLRSVGSRRRSAH